MFIDIAKRYASRGFYVFPTFLGRSGMMKPYGWALNEVSDEAKKAKAIPATKLELEINEWQSKLKEHYRADLAGYGILGRDCIILDLDDKNGKSGSNSYENLRNFYNIPECKLIVRTKSGGFHLYFKKPKRYANTHVRSLSSINVEGIKYEGVDVRGDGGFVQGPTRIGDWIEGTYTIIKGEPEDELSELPEELIRYFVGSSMSNDADALIASEINITKPSDTLSMLRRGEIPEKIEDGARNEAFYIFINALKSKGIDRVTAKIMCQQLAQRCENPDTLPMSVDVDMMLDRAFEKSIDNPYDIGLDLVDRGLTMLTGHGSKPKYILLNDNPYIMSKDAHDLSSMKEMLSRYIRNVTGPDGKTKAVNPMDIAIRRIPPSQTADTLGFKPVKAEIFQMSDDTNGTRFLNTYQAPYIPESCPHSNAYEEFKILISRIFGPIDSPEYKIGLDYAAWYIQNPDIKPVISLFLLSEKRGVGKSLFLNLLTRLYGVNKLGERQARVRNLTDLTKRFFNPTGCLLNIVDEVQFSVHKNMRQEAADFWRVLKNLITADTLEIEIKNGGSYNVLNTSGLILAGNKGSRFPIEEYDRRLWIIDNDAPVMERGVVDSLYDIVLRSGRMEGRQERLDAVNNIRWHLERHKIESHLDSMRAPMTAIKEEMYRASMTDEEEWILDYFSEPSNLLAKTPIISQSAFIFLLTNSQDVPSERWRENAAHMFREAKRRNQIKPIKYPSGQNVQFKGAPRVTAYGDIHESEKSETLYMTRDFHLFDSTKRDEILNLYKINLSSIHQWKTGSLNAKKSMSLSDLTDLKVIN